ncbi:MAG: peptidoglycan editing factor PgeF [Gemmatimonadetes bacterium]|nr:peptidoglycan editing factor PgeF [Gemmatimonadota bacterium]
MSPTTHDPLPTTLRETPVAGDVPRFEIPGWRAKHGLVAGITGRGAGEPFDLGLWSGQPVGEVMTRWKTLRTAESCLGSTALGNQVHGDRVVWHDLGFGWTILDGVDGHATDKSGLMLTVTVADCIPVYLAAPRHGGIALLHAGWRGTAAGILERGVEILSSHVRCEPFDIIMHCGVGISGDEYEVGSEVMDGLKLPAEGKGPWHVDLRSVLAEQGRKLGISDITVSEWCSARDSQHFFSHRKSGGTDGRMAAYLGALP